MQLSGKTVYQIPGADRPHMAHLTYSHGHSSLDSDPSCPLSSCSSRGLSKHLKMAAIPSDLVLVVVASLSFNEILEN